MPSLGSTEPPHFVPLDFPLQEVYALGLTYADHARETGERAQAPVVFRKTCQPVIGLQSRLQCPSSDALLNAVAALDPSLGAWLKQRGTPLPPLLDYEVELGIVLLEPVSFAQLSDPDFHASVGYVLANDITARSVQLIGEAAPDRLTFWSAAKSFPGFLPLSDKLLIPAQSWLDHQPEIWLETRVNDEQRQRAPITTLAYSLRQLLAFAASTAPEQCLQTHDLVLTGTPAGVALHMPAWKRRVGEYLPARMRARLALNSNTHNPRFLKSGDIVTIHGGLLGSVATFIA